MIFAYVWSPWKLKLTAVFIVNDLLVHIIIIIIHVPHYLESK